MGTVNEDIADALVGHRLFVLRYEAGVINAMQDRWAEHTEALVKEARRIKRRARNSRRALTRTERRRLEAIRQTIDVEFRTLREDLTERLGAGLTEVATVEAAVVAQTIEAALPAADPRDAIRVAAAPASDIARAISDPIGGNVWTNRLATDLASANNQLQAVISDAISQGSSIPNAAKALDAATEVQETYRKRFQVIARTEIQRVANQAAADTYRRNKDIIGSVQWLATLDSRTCAVCAPLHNREIPLESDGTLPVVIEGTPYRKPPIHPNCRCFVTPITKSWRDLGFDLDDPLERDRADGRKAINMSFGSWLRRQPVATQEDVLGVEKARLWRGNRLKLEQFSDSGEILSLGELRARYPDRVPPAGA